MNITFEDICREARSNRKPTLSLFVYYKWMEAVMNNKEQLISMQRYLKKKIDKHVDNSRKIIKYERLKGKLHSENYKLEKEIKTIEKEIKVIAYNVENPHYISLDENGLQVWCENGEKQCGKLNKK